jgi:hypothetical protein
MCCVLLRLITSSHVTFQHIIIAALRASSSSQVQDLAARLSVVAGEDGLSREAQRNATVMFMSLLRANMASKRVLKVSVVVVVTRNEVPHV